MTRRSASKLALRRVNQLHVQRDELQRIVDANLIHVEQSVQDAAGVCLRSFLGGYGTVADAPLAAGYCRGLFDKDSEFVRSGSGIALAAMPQRVVAPVWQDTLHALCRACNVDTAVQARDGEARVRAITVCPSLRMRGACAHTCAKRPTAEPRPGCAGAHDPLGHRVRRRKWRGAAGAARKRRCQHAWQSDQQL